MESSVRRTAIVYVSPHHGNTAKVAEVLADTLGTDLFAAYDVQDDQLAKYDLVGFGSGIYFARHHKALRELVSRSNTLPKQVFLFSTAGLPFMSRWYHRPLRRNLIRQGCRVLAEFSCRGWDTVGPLILIGGINWFHPNARDFQRAKEFASEINDATI